MKKVFSLLLVAVLVLSLAGCGNKAKDNAADTNNNVTTEETGRFKAGTYEGTAKGFGGDVTAKVTLSSDRIEAIEVTGDSETSGIGSVAIEQLPGAMVAAQAVDVDGISGASVSSGAVKEAVTAALTLAGVDVNSLKPVVSDETTEAKEETLDVDVVVVGAGGAGMTAALEAKAAGMNVILVEKAAYAGGNTLRATGGMNAAETELQKELGIEDSIEVFVKDTLEGGYNLNNVELVTVMAEKSSEAIDWLATIGAPLTELSFSGGATYKRIHRPAGGQGVGSYIAEALIKNIDENEIPVYFNTTATEILVNEAGEAVGITAESKDTNYTINAKAVILATGGFGANEELYTSYRPELEGFVTTNVPSATGDGIVLAEEIGAGTVDMEQIQIHPTVEQTTSLLITESVRGDGAILVNQSGVRFGDELRTRDVVSASVIEQEGGYAYLVFDQQLRDELSAVEKYIDNGIVVQADSIEELAAELEMDADTLKTTVDTWNEAVLSQNDTEFGRDTGMEHTISEGPFYAIKIAPGVHHTMGGLEINTSAEVISTEGAAIPGLFAAGEVAGGIHGGNRIGGTAVTDIVVFGRIAGTSAADYVKGLE
ncbi:MAG: flavocytochrome c [Lachnospiraceae bacterium]|nr:flavocytochrome c [Lachnospiraceae bacterium]